MSSENKCSISPVSPGIKYLSKSLWGKFGKCFSQVSFFTYHIPDQTITLVGRKLSYFIRRDEGGKVKVNYNKLPHNNLARKPWSKLYGMKCRMQWSFYKIALVKVLKKRSGCNFCIPSPFHFFWTPFLRLIWWKFSLVKNYYN